MSKTISLVSFYRQLDLANRDGYPKFHGQTRNPVKAIYENDTHFYGYEGQKTEGLFLLTNLRVLKNLPKNLKRP